MNSVKIISICSAKSGGTEIAFHTDPVMSEEVIENAKRRISHQTSLRIAIQEEVVILTGFSYPPTPGLFSNTEALLSEAFNEIERERERKRSEHQRIVNEYAEIANVPVV